MSKHVGENSASIPRHVSIRLRNIAMRDYKESVTTGQTDRHIDTQRDGQTDAGQSDIKTWYFLYSKFKKRHNSFKVYAKYSNLILKTLKQIHIRKIAAQYVRACRRKVWKPSYFLYSKFKKRYNSFKNYANGRHSNLICSTLTLSHMQTFSWICLNM